MVRIYWTESSMYLWAQYASHNGHKVISVLNLLQYF